MEDNTRFEITNNKIEDSVSFHSGMSSNMNFRIRSNKGAQKNMGAFIRKMSGPAQKKFPPGFFPDKSFDSKYSINSPAKLPPSRDG